MKKEIIKIRQSAFNSGFLGCKKALYLRLFSIIKILIMVIMVMAVMPAVFAAYEESGSVTVKQKTGESNLQVITLKYEPFPVNPGEYVDIWLKIGNEGDGDIRDLTFELVPEFPFSLDSSETKTRNYGRILANSMVLANYRVRINEDAVEGDEYLKYKYRYRDGDLNWRSGTIKIRIQARDAVLSIESVHTEPYMIGPGQEADVQINLKNLASSLIRDVKVKIDLTMSTVAKNPGTLVPTAVLIDSYYNALPFAPLRSSTEKVIGNIKAGGEVEVNYRIQAFPDAESKAYKVPIQISYQDELGTNYTKTDVIGLVVGAIPDIDITIDENTVYKAKSAGEVTIKIVNKGVTDVKFMNLVLEESENYDITTSNKVYIGDVDSDDYETADFKLYVKKLKQGVLELPLILEYKDANNVDFKEEIVLKATIYSPKQRGVKGSSKLSKAIILLIILGVGWFFYKRWEKRKKKKKKS